MRPLELTLMIAVTMTMVMTWGNIGLIQFPRIMIKEQFCFNYYNLHCAHHDDRIAHDLSEDN